jgi:hypothetical protein
VLSRGESLERAGARSVKLVLGIIPLLVIAGLIEGFISPSSLPYPLKFLLAAALFTLLTLYLSQKRTPAGKSISADSVPTASAPLEAHPAR